MSYDLAIWKWKDASAANNPLSVYHSIRSNDRPHPSLSRFSPDPFLNALKATFTIDGDEPDVIVEVVDFAGAKANWIFLDYPHSLTPRVPEIIALAESAGLVLFDPQTVELNGKPWQPAVAPAPPTWQFFLERTNCKKIYDPSTQVISREIKRHRAGVLILQRRDDSFLQLAGYGIASFLEHFDAPSGELRRAFSSTPSFKTGDGTTINVLGGVVALKHDEWIDHTATIPLFHAFAAATPFPTHISWRLIAKRIAGELVYSATE
jgi:hypothetical protein